jgi:hypothetical protein
MAKVTGYRELTSAEVELINEIKAHGESTLKLLAKVSAHLDTQCREEPLNGLEHWRGSHPMRWAAMAQTDLQTGYMKLVRSVAQPTGF